MFIVVVSGMQLRLRSAIHRHRPQQRAVLSQICCFGERKVVLFRSCWTVLSHVMLMLGDLKRANYKNRLMTANLHCFCQLKSETTYNIHQIYHTNFFWTLQVRYNEVLLYMF